MREMLDLLFTSEGYRTVSAADGNEALALVARGTARPDIIVADFNLPGGLTGFRDEDQAAGFAVKAVNERDGGAVYDFKSQETSQFVPKSVRSSRTGGMNQKICGFVNHQKAVIFV